MTKEDEAIDDDSEWSAELESAEFKARRATARARFAATMRDINLSSIEAFVLAAQHTSLSDAARAGGVKEDTFRKRLNALDAWANVALLQRRPDLILTPDGRRFLPIAQRIHEAVQEFRNEIGVEQARNAYLGKMRKHQSGSLKRRNTAAGFIIEID